ncbi:PLD nuclease N-terminal domain-containing protein [Mycolicibacterium mucogenicum]|uniref:PLDc_N domain-containing protein n=1 Tax=Mycolicibacterium mucogenicum DSM 44124 TaxID=1226753 RepID=A0A8H2JFV5_MYCMU|nr:PLD nuclease N-terminal domain-containing protein [Mycolicibacterium mucogenicum]QPG67975.1 PLDc_N domain-containing protein [Mycolicibacterium mucogenicum DSM 44124]
MLYFGVLDVVVLLFAIVDIACTDEHEVRGLPRLLWIFIVLLLPLAGSIAWFIAGRPAAAAPRNRTLDARRFPEYDKPGRFIPEDPAADEEFLQRCRERAEQQRQAARRQRAQDDPVENGAVDQDRPAAGPAPSTVLAPAPAKGTAATMAGLSAQYEELADLIREQLVCGFWAYDDVRESVLSHLDADSDITADAAVDLLDTMWDQRIVEQQSWPNTGDFGRLQQMFAQLASEGILGRMCFMCCNNCAFDAIDDERTPADDAGAAYPYREWAYVYFHAQDADRLGSPDPLLYLAYSAWTQHSRLPKELVDAAQSGDAAARRESVERSEVLLGEQIVAAATRCGLTPQWSGSRHERIALQIHDWRKPLPPRAAHPPLPTEN